MRGVLASSGIRAAFGAREQRGEFVEAAARRRWAASTLESGTARIWLGNGNGLVLLIVCKHRKVENHCMHAKMAPKQPHGCRKFQRKNWGDFWEPVVSYRAHIWFE